MLREDSERYAWKFRKYSRWKDVQSAADDPQCLHRMANSLLNGGSLSVNDFEGICRILERVQRWRFDKHDLSVEPNKRDEWLRLNAFLSLAKRKPSVIGRRLKDLGKLNYSNPEALIELFIISELLEFLRTAGYEVGSIGVMSQQGPLSRKEIVVLVDEIGKTIFEECGLFWEGGSTIQEDLNIILEALDVSEISLVDFHGQLINDEVDVINPVTSLEYGELERSRLLSMRFVKGANIVTINRKHPFIKKLDSLSGRQVAEAMFLAFGDTAADMSADELIIQDFISYLGLHSLEE